VIKALLASTALVALTLPANAVTVVQWDFQTPPADLTDSATSPSVAASIGTGTAVGVHASTATDWSTPAGNGSSDSLSSNTWATGDYYQFSFATTGFAGMTLSFDQTRSSTGPDSFKLAYSTNGGSSFTDFATYTVGAVTWSSATPNSASTFTFDLSGVSALDNNPAVVLRLVSNVTPAAGGTNRVDNFTVVMSPVPEPGAMALLLAGLAGVGFVARRRA
jgi:hypothetical protein